MNRFFEDTFRFDFGDDSTGIWWEASVVIDTKYDAVDYYTVNGVHACGKVMKWEDTPSDLKDKIRDRMNNVEISDFIS